MAASRGPIPAITAKEPSTVDNREGLEGAAEDDMKRATWFCIDIECSGPVPGLYDMISLGAVAVHENGDGTLSIGGSLYQELKPQGPRVDPGAMEVNGLDLDRLKREGLERRAALEELTAWVSSHVAPGAKAVFVGHNAPFDWSFVSWCFAAEEMPNPFGYKALDTKALATGVLGVHWLDSSKEVLAEALCLPVEDLSQKHRADYDAAYQAQILVALLERSRGVAGRSGAT
jgi:ribonuclease T